MYFGGFANREDVARNFFDNERALDGVTILLAAYDCGGYDGTAFVLFEHGDKLYEVNGSHCSCYGLEDQWQPEETSWLELYHRATAGRLGEGYGGISFTKELLELIRGRWGVA